MPGTDTAEPGMALAGQHTAGALEALAGDTGSADTAKQGGLWGADVVAVEAGDGEGLEDVQFDEFHWVVWIGFMV
jgi:hypothetical protein